MARRRSTAAAAPRTEFELISRFLSPFGPPAPPLGPGDDCAVLPPSRVATCVTTDATVEGVHFTRDGFSALDVGHKALAVNLSDLAAMGARPTWFLCALGVPEWLDGVYLDGLAEGMAALARTWGVRLVGGNVTRSPVLSLTLTVAGAAPRRGALLRSGGRPKDLLYVSGTLGGARLGLHFLQAPLARAKSTLPSEEVREAYARQRRPLPRLELGQLAARFAGAAIDLSDGLAQDLGHLCLASGVGATLDLSRLPMSEGVRRWCRSHHLAQRFALEGGEDYELLLAVPPVKAAAFERACERAGERVTRVGELVRGEGVRALGTRRRLPGGFDHLRTRMRRPSRVGV